jgi:hypothetical protein
MFLDADEFLLPPMVEKLQQLFASLPALAERGYTEVKLFDVRGRGSDGKPLLKFPRTRLILRKAGYRWVGFVHEYLTSDQPTKTWVEGIEIEHDKPVSAGSRNLQIYLKKIREKAPFTERDLHYLGRELFYTKQYALALEALMWHQTFPCHLEDRIDGLRVIADCLVASKRHTAARRVLFKTLELVSLRPEIAYRVGQTLEAEKAFEDAIAWYRSAMHVSHGGFWTDPACSSWKPALQIAICYWYLNKREEANQAFVIAQGLNPTETAIIENAHWFA